MYKKCLLLLLSIACIKLLPAQNLPSTLLWKISGNGLQKPSYLFGTMHLTDERVFNIGDSVYKAIENSEGFATEIDPEEFTPLFIDETKKWMTESKRLKDMMDEDKFHKYGKILAKKLNKNENDITTADVLREKNKWVEESYKTGKMQTFLDAYLFDVARRQGKWTGGVEDLKDQEDITGVIDESDIEELAVSEDEKDMRKEYNLSEEFFIKTYINADLNTIDSISSAGDSLYEDALLIKRNRKMAMRMDSLSHERSMVFAVGAAHLPGNKGLIMLLKQKGFRVEPVFASKRIKAKDYKVADINLPWYDVKDEAGFYTATMPGKPGNLTMYGLLTMKMYFDVFASTVYMTTALQTPYSEHMADSVFGVVASYYFGSNNYTAGKPVTIDNIPGREFFSTKENYSHGYLLYKSGIMYMVIGMSMKTDTSAASSINRFMHSFTILTNTPGANNNVLTYTNALKGYQIGVPVQPKPADDLIPSSKDTSTKKEINIVTDPVSGAYLFFGVNEAAPGFNIINDSVLFAGIRSSQKEKFMYLDIDTEYIKNGHRVMQFGGIMKQAPLMLKAYYETRGNRWYALVAMYDTAKTHTSVERFFNSFKMLDYPAQHWDNYSPADKSFSTWAPLNFTYSAKPSGDDTIYNYETFDSSRADTYAINLHNFTKYYWQTSDSALWNQLINESLENSDSLLFKKQVINGEAKGYEIEIQEQGSQNIKRIRMLLNGNSIYKLYSVQAAQEINNTNSNKFFEDFRFTSFDANNTLHVSKADVVLTDISSADSAVRSKALSHLTASPFTQKELPLLHYALLKTYPENEDGVGVVDQIKKQLKKIIISLKDTSSYSFAKNHYASADDETKNILLVIMASFPTKENFNDIKNILLNQSPRITPSYSFISCLKDTLSLTAGIFPDLLPLLRDTIMAPVIVETGNTLVDSNLLDKAILQSYQTDILQLSQKKYKLIQADPDDYDAVDYELVKLLGKVNMPGCNTMLQKWSLLNSVYLSMDAVRWLLYNNQPVNPLAIQALAKDKSVRIELYDTLKAYKKDQLFPKQYLTQKYFAESYVYTAASDDDDPAALTYLTQKVINFKGRQSRFFFYKVTYGEDDNVSYSLACAGPFHINVSDVSAKDATGDIYYDDDFDPSNLPAQMDALLKQMEDWYTWEDEKQKDK